MSESCQVLLDADASLKEAPALAERVLNFLFERQIVVPAPFPPNWSSSWKGAAGAKAPEVCLFEEGEKLYFNDFVVEVERQVHNSNMGDFSPDLAICRFCDAELDDEDAIFGACEDWQKGNDRAELKCPECGQSSLLKYWDFDGYGGVGNLAFRFWTWPMLKPEFIVELEKLIGHPLIEVETRL